MDMPPWTVVTCPPVFCTPRALAERVVHMQCLGLTAHRQRDGLSAGQIIFGTTAPDVIAIAWDWAELRRRIFTISDPMSAMSNAQLVSDEGQPCSPSMAAVYIHTAIYQLRWHLAIALHLKVGPVVLTAKGDSPWRAPPSEQPLYWTSTGV